MNLLGNAIDALEMGQKEQIINVPGLSASAAATYFSSQKPEIEPADINGSSESLIPDFSYPSIRIRTELIDETTVGICIADNGHGIPKELISHIFNPFFTTKPVGRGTGLGLSISYQIVVEKHQGSLKCISVPGRGTEFWIEIPVN